MAEAVRDNPALWHLGLPALTEVTGDVLIERNDALPTCVADELVAGLTVSGTVVVQDNLDGGQCL